MTKRELIEMPVGDVLTSKDQPRREGLDGAALDELADSIRAVGVLEPILVRTHQHNGDHPLYQLVAGERRLRAAMRAGLKAVPALLVDDMDDEAAADAAVAENMGRMELSPMEQAEAAAQRLARHGGDVSAAATGLGMTPYRLAQLARIRYLHPTWQRAASRRGSAVHGWGTEQLGSIARLPADEQESLYRQLAPSMPVDPTVGELSEIIGRRLRDLETAPWKLDDDTLLVDRPACSTCPDRASEEPLLFPDLKADLNRCTHSVCWSRKLDAHVDREAACLPAEAILVAGDGPEAPEIVAGLRVRPVAEVERTTRKAGGVPVLVASGPDAGRRYYGRIKEGAKSGHGGRPAAGEHVEPRRWRWVARKVRARLQGDCPAPDLHRLLRLVAAFGSSLRLDAPGTAWAGSDDSKSYVVPMSTERELSDPSTRYQRYVIDSDILTAHLWEQLRPVLLRRLRPAKLGDVKAHQLEDEMRTFNDAIGVDLDDLYRRATRAVPDGDRST